MHNHKLARTATVMALCLGTAVPLIPSADAEPCPPTARRYTATMEHQIGDLYDVYQVYDGEEGLAANIAQLTRAYHNNHPNQDGDAIPQVPLIPEPSFLPFFGNEAPPTPGHFQNQTYALHRKSANLHEQCGENAPYCHWAWGVNPKHNDFNSSAFATMDIVRNLRCRPEGVTLIGYALPREGTLRTNDNFLVTITDLTPAHLPFLRELKRQTLEYMTNVFGFDAAHDTAQLYFHYPTGRATSVLHLHSKINFSMSPTEQLRGYTLDEVIYALENPETYPRGVTSLIARRWTAFGAVLLERSDDADVQLWSLLNTDLSAPINRGPHFRWIAEHVKTAYRMPGGNLVMQVTGDAGREMTTTTTILDGLRASYTNVIRAQLPVALRNRLVPDGVDDPNFYSVIRCLYPAALRVPPGREAERIYHVKCLEYDRQTNRVVGELPHSSNTPVE